MIMTWNRRTRTNVLSLVIVLAALLLLTACTDGEVGIPTGEAITIDALPDGPGRGFAEVEVLAEDNRGLRVGEAAPDFRMQLVDGRYIDIQDLKGRPVLINFWATWCPPCRREMPDIIAASEASDDLVVLSVNVQEELKVVGPFVDDFGITMPVIRDVDGDLRDAYRVSGMPTSIFIDRNGNISKIWTGLLDSATLDRLLDEIL
jgi:thiol-disulfide isomerase/thioredoxin